MFGPPVFLTNANFREANLTRAMFMFADLEGADLAGADLTNAQAGWSNFAAADMTGAILAEF
jgi:serine/threonine-protein kinase